MPVSEYYGGKGREVMRGMLARYGKRGKSVFYATANKRKVKVRERHSESRPHREERGREGHRS